MHPRHSYASPSIPATPLRTIVLACAMLGAAPAWAQADDTATGAATPAGASIDQSELQAGQLCAAIDGFCAALLQRLEKEERELFALARKVIVGEAWFAIAYQFLAHDARAQEARRGKAQVLPFVLPVPLPAPGTPAGAADTADTASIAGTAADDALPAIQQPLRAQA